MLTAGIIVEYLKEFEGCFLQASVSFLLQKSSQVFEESTGKFCLSLHFQKIQQLARIFKTGRIQQLLHHFAQTFITFSDKGSIPEQDPAQGILYFIFLPQLLKKVSIISIIIADAEATFIFLVTSGTAFLSICPHYTRWVRRILDLGTVQGALLLLACMDISIIYICRRICYL